MTTVLNFTPERPASHAVTLRTMQLRLRRENADRTHAMRGQSVLQRLIQHGRSDVDLPLLWTLSGITERDLERAVTRRLVWDADSAGADVSVTPDGDALQVEIRASAMFTLVPIDREDFAALVDEVLRESLRGDLPVCNLAYDYPGYYTAGVYDVTEHDVRFCYANKYGRPAGPRWVSREQVVGTRADYKVTLLIMPNDDYLTP